MYTWRTYNPHHWSQDSTTFTTAKVHSSNEACLSACPMPSCHIYILICIMCVCHLIIKDYLLTYLLTWCESYPRSSSQSKTAVMARAWTMPENIDCVIIIIIKVEIKVMLLQGHWTNKGRGLESAIRKWWLKSVCLSFCRNSHSNKQENVCANCWCWQTFRDIFLMHFSNDQVRLEQNHFFLELLSD